MKYCVLLGLAILLSVLIVSPMSASHTINSADDQPHRLSLPADYSPHGPIIIQSDEDFAAQSWAGSGTIDDPYRISGFEFSTDATAIEISGTSAYFVIADCYFSAITDPFAGQGIKFDHLQNGFVNNCIFTYINGGIMLEYGDACVVSNCTMDQSNIPLTLYESDTCLISGNKIAGMVMVYDSDDCSILRNNQTQYGLSDDSVGFELTWSDRCTIANNSFSRNTYGLWMSCCFDLRLENNTFVENGLVLRGAEEAHYIIEESNNMVNDLPLGYFSYEAEHSIDATGFGQLVLVKCRDTLVENGHFENATIGILVAYSIRCNITGVTSRDNTFGISFEHVVDCQLRDSMVVGNHVGVFLTELSQEISIIENTIRDNNEGIGFDSAESCTILDNLIVDNEHIGLGVGGSGSVICYNTFGRNGLNAADYGFGNLWDNEIDCGNFWDDAVLGAVYVIPGDAGSVDRYPNGTAGTYTPLPTTGNNWIGNDTGLNVPIEALLIVASGVVIVIIVTLVVYARRKGVA